jgi:hypothetical protein
MRKYWRKGRQTLQVNMEVEASQVRESPQPVKVKQIKGKEMRSTINDRAFNHGLNSHSRNARSNQIINIREEMDYIQQMP